VARCPPVPERGDGSAWSRRYAERTTGWDRGEASPALAHWLATAAVSAGRILLPGCGRGHEVEDLVRAGFAVTAVDIVAQPIAELGARLDRAGLDAELVQADLFDWEPRQPFDAVYEQTCLCAFPPTQWDAYEERLRRWLRPGGTLLALFMQTGREGGPPFDCPLVAMRQLCSATDWIWPDGPPLPIPHPSGIRELGHVLTRR